MTSQENIMPDVESGLSSAYARIGEVAADMIGSSKVKFAVLATGLVLSLGAEGGCGGAPAGTYAAPEGATRVTCNDGKSEKFSVVNGQTKHFFPGDGSGEGVRIRHEGKQTYVDGEPVFKGWVGSIAVQEGFDKGGVYGTVTRKEKSTTVEADC